MAIHDDSNQQQPAGGASQQQPASGYAGGYSQPAASDTPAGAAGLVNVNHYLHRTGNYDGTESRSAEALNSLQAAHKEALATQVMSEGTELYRFDRDANRVGLPSILVVRTFKRDAQVFAVVRTLILDTNAVRLKPRPIQIGAERIEVATLTQHVFNDKYWDLLSNFLRTNRGITTMQVVDAGPLRVPTDFDFKDAVKVTNLLVASSNRCEDIVQRLRGEAPFNISAIKRADEFFTSRLDLTGQPQHDIVGEPIRSDMVISMGRSTKTVQDPNDFYDADSSFNSLSCFVNLEYTPPQGPVQGAWNPQAVPTQLFTPTIVITNVRQADWIKANTPELYLLALGNAYRSTANTSWAKSFLPVVGKKKDPRDIGAIGFLSPVAQKIKTKGDGFTDQNFAELMQTLIKPLPAFLIDVNPLGENAAIETYFLEAAGNGVNKGRAKQAIIKAANNLYSNKFSEFFDDSKNEICVPYGVDVNLGYYFDEHSEKRDIRDLGTLEMLNATDGDIGQFMQWYRTMCDTSIPTELRNKQREGFENLYLGANLVRTGLATRLLFTQAFIEALDKAALAAGVNVSFENLTAVFGGQRFAGNEMIGQYTVGGAAQASYGQATTQTGYGVNTGPTSGRVY